MDFGYDLDEEGLPLQDDAPPPSAQDAQGSKETQETQEKTTEAQAA
jgi:hypothetical protein